MTEHGRQSLLVGYPQGDTLIRPPTRRIRPYLYISEVGGLIQQGNRFVACVRASERARRGEAKLRACVRETMCVPVVKRFDCRKSYARRAARDAARRAPPRTAHGRPSYTAFRIVPHGFAFFECRRMRIDAKLCETMRNHHPRLTEFIAPATCVPRPGSSCTVPNVMLLYCEYNTLSLCLNS